MITLDNAGANEFSIQTIAANQYAVILMAGELKSSHARELVAAVEASLEAGATSLSLDVEMVSAVDASGVAALRQARKIALSRNAELHVIAATA